MHHLYVTTVVAVVAFVLTVVLVFLVAVVLSRRRGRVLGRKLRLGFGRSCPAGNFPAHAREALQLEPALGPFPTGLAGAVEGSETCVDGALICLRS